MGEEQDVKNNGAQSGAGDDLQDGNHQKAGAGSDIPGGEKNDPKDIPYPRFKEVVDKANGLEKVVNFFRQHIESPEQLLAFKEWQKEQLEKAKADEQKGDITPEQLAKFKRAMDLANPKLAAVVERLEREQESKLDAQFDAAEEQIRELCDANGLPTENEKVFSRIAVHIMDEIRSDEKLLRMWHAGNMKCVDKAFKNYTDEYLKTIRGNGGKKAEDKQLAERRRIMRIPALPSGRTAGPSGPPERKNPEDKGITKQAHEDAWAVFQSHMQD